MFFLLFSYPINGKFMSQQPDKVMQGHDFIVTEVQTNMNCHIIWAIQIILDTNDRNSVTRIVFVFRTLISILFKVNSPSSAQVYNRGSMDTSGVRGEDLGGPRRSKMKASITCCLSKSSSFKHLRGSRRLFHNFRGQPSEKG